MTNSEENPIEAHRIAAIDITKIANGAIGAEYHLVYPVTGGVKIEYADNTKSQEINIPYFRLREFASWLDQAIGVLSEEMEAREKFLNRQ